MNDPELDRVLADVSALRSVGFYASYRSASVEELWDILRAEQDHANAAMPAWMRPVSRRKRSGPPFRVGLKAYNLLGLACMDPAKFLFFDTEAVYRGESAYVRLIESLSTLSGGAFRPTEISEAWVSDDGPITVTFRVEDETIHLQATYRNDWIDMATFTTLVELINVSISDQIYEVADGAGLFGSDQEVALVRLNAEHRARFEEALPWKIRTEKW